jgi:hypothetical protein
MRRRRGCVTHVWRITALAQPRVASALVPAPSFRCITRTTSPVLPDAPARAAFAPLFLPSKLDIMQTRQGNLLQSLRNVQSFLDDNTPVLDSVVQTGARRRLDEVITQLASHASVQEASHIASQGSTRQQGVMRTMLLDDHMSPIARIARADLPNTPAIEPLRMPKGRPSTERLATAAYGMAKAAVPFAPVFVAAGLSVDFVARLNAAAGAMIDAVGDGAQN